MITTHEPIVDPVAFIEADASLVDSLQPGEAIALSGPDIDIAVRRPGSGDVVRSGRISEQTSRYLGNLYIQSAAYGVNLRGKAYDFEWFPSPHAVNGLVAALGLRPGEDVMRFTHSEGAKTPVERYFKHVADGEFPQSTDASSGIFAHDRNKDHAIGALLMPKGAKDTTVKIAGNGGMRTDLERRSKVKGLADAFDSTTATLGIVADRMLWPRLKAGEEGVIDELTRKDTYMTYFYYPQLWPVTSKRYKQQRREILTMICEHLLELQPKVAKLQAEVSQAPAEA